MPPSRWDIAEQRGYDRRELWKNRLGLTAFWIVWSAFVYVMVNTFCAGCLPW